ncbi:hypothetical protein [Tsukamurella paurometabola]|uniref:Uncharacterized protein n=1 Tax=Tsukamurella paurometabola TaxID=2061 RepID=A0ABS5NFN7_TSUPA|nr:hypothetical protein [Tsukamurella paurometabola]MBS4103089.1 hypothetical protein [Tsukamurella paurometabola]
MAKEKRSVASRLIGRFGMKAAALAAALVLGLIMGAGCTSGSGVDRERVDACLPVQTAAQLDECLAR